mgnify:CR=1 FL=1
MCKSIRPVDTAENHLQGSISHQNETEKTTGKVKNS